MRGFIEATAVILHSSGSVGTIQSESRILFPIHLMVVSERGSNCSVIISGDEGAYHVKESFDEIKKLIAESL